jgi:hypothetical protein
MGIGSSFLIKETLHWEYVTFDVSKEVRLMLIITVLSLLYIVSLIDIPRKEVNKFNLTYIQKKLFVLECLILYVAPCIVFLLLLKEADVFGYFENSTVSVIWVLLSFVTTFLGYKYVTSKTNKDIQIDQLLKLEEARRKRNRYTCDLCPNVLGIAELTIEKYYDHETDTLRCYKCLAATSKCNRCKKYKKTEEECTNCIESTLTLQ